MIEVKYPRDAQNAIDAIDNLIDEYRIRIIKNNVNLDMKDLHRLIFGDETLIRLYDSKAKIMQYSTPIYKFSIKQ